MGASAILLSVALNPGIGLGPPEMQCGFPAILAGEPSISMEIALASSLNASPGARPVHLELSTGTNDMRMAGVVQPLGPIQAPILMFAGSPMVNIHFSVGLNGDGSASLTIRDSRRGDAQIAEVTRMGRCQDHETFFMMFDGF